LSALPTQFGNGNNPPKLIPETEVSPPAENKVFAELVTETKVTGAFGEAGANIEYGCDVRRDSKNR